MKRRDAWWTVAVIDPIAAPLVGAVRANRHVTPDRLTLFSLASAFVAAGLFARSHLVLGAVLFQLSFLFDCMDGKLAHTRGEAGEFGPWYDATVDALRAASCYAGLVWTIAQPTGISASAAVAIAAYPIFAFAVVTTGSAWPRRAVDAAPLVLEASFRSFVAAIPRRLSPPGSTVDAEAVAFTIGPLVGHPLLGIVVALAIDAAQFSAKTALRVSSSRKRAGDGTKAVFEARGDERNEDLDASAQTETRK